MLQVTHTQYGWLAGWLAGCEEINSKEQGVCCVYVRMYVCVVCRSGRFVYIIVYYFLYAPFYV